MRFEDALKVLDDLVYAKRGKHLSNPEKILIEGAWYDRGYDEIANNSPYSVNYLQRDIAPQLWNLLSEVIGNGRKFGKKKLRHFLEQKLAKPNSYYLADVKQPKAFDTLPYIIGGQPPEVSNFYGRSKELDQLKVWMLKQRCIVLTGAAGIGKSTLAAELVKIVSAEPEVRFDSCIWKSVSYAPLLQDVVTELIKLTSPLKTDLELPGYTQAKISLLLERLRENRFLLVFDAAEALLQGDRNNSFNPYGERYADYKLFFQRLVEEQHQSCLLLISREPFNDLTLLEAGGRPVSSQKLEGLDPQAATQLLQSLGLTDREECSNLINKYWGNPSDLEKVVNRIQLLFGASNERFLKQYKTTVIGSQSQASLDELFSQSGFLNELQRQIMIYIAEETLKNPNPISFTKLANDFKNHQEVKGSELKLSDALIKLKERSLIERIEDPMTKQVGFAQRPVVRKYILTDPQGLVRKSSTTTKSA